jgi:hypothetical protein
MMLPCGFSRLGGTVHESSLCFEATLIPLLRLSFEAP